MLRRSSMLLVFAAITAACGGSGGDPNAGEVGDEPRPDWVLRVVPEPAATTAPDAAVEVDHEAVAPDEAVRLMVDGRDVTAYAVLDTGTVRYEPADGPFPLEPGMHTATVQRTEFRVEGAAEVIDEWSWSFRVL